MSARSETPGGPAIATHGLSKRYGEIEAVKGVDLEVGRGEIFGLLGPNGAGKSTMIKMLCTLTPPTDGTASVAGHDVVRRQADVRRSIGLVFQEQTLDRYLTGRQNLRFHADIYGVPSGVAEERVDEALRTVDLLDHQHRAAGTYSGGMRRRLEIVRAMLHRPAVLFLDEPTVSLDPQTRQTIWDGVREINQRDGTTVFMTTHYLEEAENCHRIAIIDRGGIVALGSPQELKDSVGKDRVELDSTDSAGVDAVLREVFDVTAVVEGDKLVFHVAEGEKFLPELFSRLDGTVRSVRVTQPSLDDVYLSYTGTSFRDADKAEHDEDTRLVGR
ncbi:ATP-binding cassette domain-containing protein [Nocardiopsis sp. ATB16-24]|uniref:ATP-binding cassette domain-containing protein n=1 Tax=Nocardiopsis sp. ATB16-24 TaxID=3019555 RepID=UPI002556CC0D|nr:ATP-binding cassette domain-containing protein [Nocardiopsis sp. ATB16-24]